MNPIKPPPPTFYFDSSYRCFDSKKVKAHLTLETVFGEITFGMTGLIFFFALYLSIYLAFAVVAIIKLYDTPLFCFITILAFTLLIGPIIYLSGSRVWHFYRSIQQWQQLKKEGIVCRGYVLACRTEATSNNDKAEWIKVDYSFTTPDGQELKGSQVKRMADPIKPAPGTPLAILYAGKNSHVVL
jgi:hypothetical protein